MQNATKSPDGMVEFSGMKDQLEPPRPTKHQTATGKTEG